MALTITLSQAIRAVIRKTGIGYYVQNADWSIGSSTTFVVTSRFANTNLGNNAYEGWIVWRPGAATSADYLRFVSSIDKTTGTATIDRAWVDTDKTSEDLYLLHPHVHPQQIIDAANFAASEIYFENQDPLSLLADPGFQSTLTTYWTESDADGGPATTFSKITTADSIDVYPGMIGSGQILNSQAGGYIRQRVDVHPGEAIRAGLLARADVGSCQLVLYDVTNSTTIATSTAHSGEQWAYLHLEVNVPLTCETVEYRIVGVEASANIKVNGAWLWRTRDNIIRLATTWDMKFKVPSLAYLSFSHNIASGVEGAFSGDSVMLPDSTYGFLSSRPAANPFGIRFAGSVQRDRPIWIMGRRPYSDLVTFSLGTLTDTIAVDLDLFESEMRLQLINMGDIKAKLGPMAQVLLQDAYWDRQDAARQGVIDPLPRTSRFGEWASAPI